LEVWKGWFRVWHPWHFTLLLSHICWYLWVLSELVSSFIHIDICDRLQTVVISLSFFRLTLDCLAGKSHYCLSSFIVESWWYVDTLTYWRSDHSSVVRPLVDARKRSCIIFFILVPHPYMCLLLFLINIRLLGLTKIARHLLVKLLC
jgi:hypothetical protein